MPFISITIEGLPERIAGLQGISERMQQANNTIYNEIANFMVSEMRNNAHVITGFMKSSIRYDIFSDGANVEVTAPYAIYENARVGGAKAPHDFATRAVNATQNMAMGVVKREYDYVFSNL
jgi:Bacteriophage protein of unknown function (DUF646).